MKLYEILFVVHPNYEESRLTKIIDNVKEKITNNNGNIINVDDMGKKKLAYKIDNHRYGTYILIHFESEPQFISEFKKWLQIQTQILTKIIVSVDKEDIEIKNKEKVRPAKVEETKENVDTDTENNIDDEDEVKVEEAVEEEVEEKAEDEVEEKIEEEVKEDSTEQEDAEEDEDVENKEESTDEEN
ncbi:MAG: 30S ribosomal protein S6 [Candidatus Marinimicrobia bacterium]|nr:30S ribosomal protein S6 [Candidatus Neomarinimicrobiota bacterium]